MKTNDRLKEALRRIATRAGAPTMHYSPDNERKEQRDSLNWIAAEAIRALGLQTPERVVTECAKCGHKVHVGPCVGLILVKNSRKQFVPEACGCKHS